MSKHTILNLVIKTLNLDPNILQYNQKHGIYIGLTSQNSCKYIAEKLRTNIWNQIYYNHQLIFFING